MNAFVVTVDVEPDGRDPDAEPAADWQGFPECVALLERLRSRLRQRTGMPVVFSWFLRMDPEVEARSGSAGYLAEAYPGLLRGLVAQGDELGLHVHAFRRDGAGAWYSEHADAEWIRRSVRAALRTFARATGRPARSFRFGDRFLSNDLIAELARRGVRYDLTLESGQKAAPRMVASERASGSLPDFRAASRDPYRPDRRDYLRPADSWWRARRLWMVPVTTACVNGPALPATVGDSHDMVHLNLGLRGEWIGLILDAVLGVDQPVVTSVLRTGDLTSPAAHAALVENLERLAEHPRIAERSFTDPAGAVASFRRRARRIVAPGH